MAVIRNTASALRKGKVGNETYYVSLNKQIVRVAQNDSNYGETASRTESQQSNRVKWANLVNFYKISSSWMRKAFENKKSNQTDYNRFMQLNLSQSRIYLTREAAQAGSVVADRFAISQGSLRSIDIQQVGNTWQTDIKLGLLAITDETTVLQFTQAVLDNNSWAELGMQISFISYQQLTDPFGFPKAVCTAYELTLDNTDTRLVRDLLPVFCSTTSEAGYLGTNDNISEGAFAYVLSQTRGGKTLVSTQTLIANNGTMIAQYSSAQALQRAIDSYGVQEAAFLDSGSMAQNATPQPFYLAEMSVSSITTPILPNSPGELYDSVRGKACVLTFSTELPEGVTISSITFYLENGQTRIATTYTIAEDRKSVSFSAPNTSAALYIDRVAMVTSVGTFNMQFDNSGRIHE